MDVCLLWILCVVRYRSLWRADHSSGGTLPTVVHRTCTRNLRNEEAVAYVVLQHHRGGKKSLNKGWLWVVGRRGLVFCTGIFELRVSQTAAGCSACLSVRISVTVKTMCLWETPNFHRCFYSTFSFQSTLPSITVVFTSIFVLRAKWKVLGGKKKQLQETVHSTLLLRCFYLWYMLYSNLSRVYCCEF